MDVLAARDFESAIDEVSRGGRYFFLEEQLYYLLCARRASRLRDFAAGVTKRRPGRIDRAEFEKAFREYASRASIPCLIDTKAEFEIRSRGEADIRDYAFDFLIVTEKEAFARLLLLNGFHFHHRAAVVSRGGFPRPLFEHFVNTAREFQDVLPVCLHDASPSGLSLPDFARREWGFGEERLVMDAGLRPRDFLEKTSRLFTSTVDPARDASPQGDFASHDFAGAEYRGRLTDRENDFLDRGLRLELANLAPHALMTMLGRYLRRRKRERSVFFAD